VADADADGLVPRSGLVDDFQKTSKLRSSGCCEGSHVDVAGERFHGVPGRERDAKSAAARPAGPADELLTLESRFLQFTPRLTVVLLPMRSR